MSPYRTTFNVQIPQKNQSIGPYFLPKNKKRIISHIEKRTYSSPFFAILHEILTCVFYRSSHFYVTEKSTPLQRFYVISGIFQYTCL